MFLCFLSGCTTKKEVKSVTINDKTYYPLYIHSFNDAEISSEYKVLFVTPVEQPTEEGFVITNNKDADYVDVWTQFVFTKNSDAFLTSVSSNDLTVKAKVITLEKEFPIIIKENTDTYTVTYYTYDYSTDLEMDRLVDNALEKHSIEVAKENALIEYYN